MITSSQHNARYWINVAPFKKTTYAKIMHIMQMEAKASAYKSIAKW